MIGCGLLAALALCAALAAPALAAPAPRTYNSQIKGFQDPEAVTVAPDDKVWVSSVQNGVVSTYDAFPSQTRLAEQTGGGGIWGGGYMVRSLAVSAANEFLYVGVDTEEGAACGGTPYAIFDNYANLFQTGQTQNRGNACQMWFTVDNDPESDSYGDYYLFTGMGPAVLGKYDGYGNRVDFTASGGYIEGNEILGTPKKTFPSDAAGSFSPSYSGIAVDPNNGNLWLLNNAYEETEIDEFDSTGRFLRRITEKSAGVPPSVTPASRTPKFGGGQGLTGIAVDPTNSHILVSDRAGLVIDEFSPQGEFLGQLTGADTPAGKFGFECQDIFGDPNNRICSTRVVGISVNSEGYVYVTDADNDVVDIFNPAPREPTIVSKPDSNPTATGGTVNALVDPNGGGAVTSCHIDLGTDAEFQTDEYKLGPIPCAPDPGSSNFSVPTEVHADLTGLATETTTYHYRFVVGNAVVTRVGPDRTYTPHHVLGLRADPPSGVTGTAATLNGSFVGNGVHTTYWFEYGLTTAYGSKSPLPAPPGGDAGSPAGPNRTTEELALTGLSPVTRYHYRIVAENGSVSTSDDQSFRTTAVLPESKAYVTDVHSNQVLLNTQVNPGGSDTIYTFEYGTEKCSQVPDPCTTPFPDTHIGMNLAYDSGAKHLQGLEAGKTYYYRVIATNAIGTSHSADRRFSTYPFTAEIKDSCTNLLARQQTGAALLPDCRGYELVSSSHAGGYDVESNLVPGQTPFSGYPQAESPLRVLYGVHNGAIPGVAGNPTNRGVDPYLATRGSEGWTTSYVGIPADNPNATAPFASTLAEADPTLDTFAFSAADVCSPCFSDGSTGVPLHLPDGSLVQGMRGSMPAADSHAGRPRQEAALGRRHAISSSAPNPSSRRTETTPATSRSTTATSAPTQTQVVSKDPLGSNLPCLQGAGLCHGPGDAAGISELDISEDGSRIVVGQKVSTDADGNDYYHLYMHVGADPNTVDLTPGATDGVLYDGMTADGSRVYFTTKDALTTASDQDTDTSADIYRADVGASVTIARVSTGSGAGNTDACAPPGGWNSVGGGDNCDVVAVAGGGGVAANDGSIYFFSPEKLDSGGPVEPVPDQVNLYVSHPGSPPEFIATVDSSTTKPPPEQPSHRVAKKDLITGLSRPDSLAVDQNSGDIYVAEAEAGRLSRWKANGAPANFSSSGSNQIEGQSFGFREGQVAVDSSNSPFKGDFYTTTNSGSVNVYASSGEELGKLTGFGEACGVAVDQSNGDVYVGSYFSAVRRFRPISAAAPVSNASYEAETGIESPNGLCNVDASSEGHVYTWPYTGGAIQQFDSSAFSAGFPTPAGKAFATGLNAQSDPQNGDLYVDEETGITQYDPAGDVIEKFGHLSESHGIGVNGKTGHVYATTAGGTVVDYVYAAPPYEPIDNPAVVHGVRNAGTRHSSDFQITPSDGFAAFPTGQALDPGFENLGHTEIYRYQPSTEALVCVSCSPTNALSTGDASLGTNGLSLLVDGRMFFDSEDALVLRDGDNRKDVYEWEERGLGTCDAESPNYFPTETCLGLISSGTSSFDSSLLSASADGTDAFFFTHDSLAHEDENGPVAKLYDARTDGGIFDIPPPAKCAASDECHGPGTRAADTPPIRTIAGTPGNGVADQDEEARMQEGIRQEARPLRASPARPPSEEAPQVSAKTISAALAATLALAFASAAPARAEEGITSFSTTSSTTQAGGHPDLQTSFALEEPGVHEATKNVIFNAPQGLFGNINAVTNCQPAEFALDKCPPNSQVGLITVHAELRRQLRLPARHGAALRRLAPGRPDGAPPVRRADPEHPDLDPDHGAHRQRLRAALHGSPTSPS